METAAGMLQVKVVDFVGHLFVLEEEESCQEGREDRPVVDCQLVSQFLEHSQVRIVGALHKAVQNDGHLVQLINVVGHDFNQLLNSIL